MHVAKDSEIGAGGEDREGSGNDGEDREESGSRTREGSKRRWSGFEYRVLDITEEELAE